MYDTICTTTSDWPLLMKKFNDFPLQIASGGAFCNRVDERKKLKKLLLTGQHIWLQAHRRHGKTSLLLKTFEDITQKNKRFTHTREDLAFASDRNSVIVKLCNSASKLIIDTLKKATPRSKSDQLSVIGNRLSEMFNRFTPTFSIEKGSVSMRFSKEPSLEMLDETLSKLNEIAKEHDVRTVFMIDEFQQLSKVDNNRFDIEGVIRHNLELATNVTYVLCGSERSLMEQALGDENRPLYKHLYQFQITRLSRDSYLSHIKALWATRWGKEMDLTVFNYVIETSKRHPYYLNYLFSELWLNEHIPTDEDAELAWSKILQEELSKNKKMILELRPNEKKVLIALAIKPTKEILSSEFVKLAGIASGSMKRTISQLIAKDLIYTDNERLTLISPALAAIAIS